jgi:hypothetical protein
MLCNATSPELKRKRKMKNTMGILAFGLFVSLFFIVGFGILGFAGYSLYKSKQAEGWPTADGKIVSCKLKENIDSEGNSYQVDAKYTYWANGKTWEGSKIAFGYSGGSGRQVHQEITDRLKNASGIRVRYNPSKPSEAVLACGVNRSIITLFIFGLTWTVFTTGFTLLFALGWGSDNHILNTLITVP